MKARYKIGIWGQFGDGVNKIADGQAVRTTIITNELKMRYGEESIRIANTNNWKRHPFRFLWKSFLLVARSKKIVILPADNGFKVGMPLFGFFNFFFHREMYYVVIGGFLPALLKEKRGYIKTLKKYRALFVQTPNLKKDLEEFGLENIHILSNLKRLNSVKLEELSVNHDPDIRLCTLSRVDESKGIAVAAEAVRMVNAALGEKHVTLDVYGIPAPDYKDRFDLLLSEYEDVMRYGGVLDFDKTTEGLRSYFALLFPTYYYGEGFPGNVVDAYNAGIPIIATDWLYNKDVIADGFNGILIPIKDAQALCDAILSLYNDREKAFEIAKNNVEEAKKYTPDKVLAEFYSYMDVE